MFEQPESYWWNCIVWLLLRSRSESVFTATRRIRCCRVLRRGGVTEVFEFGLGDDLAGEQLVAAVSSGLEDLAVAALADDVADVHLVIADAVVPLVDEALVASAPLSDALSDGLLEFVAAHQSLAGGEGVNS